MRFSLPQHLDDEAYDKVEVRTLGEGGHRGTVALVPLPAGTFLFRFRGEIVTKEEMMAESDPDNDHYLQLSSDLYLGPADLADDMVNHSCDPNCGVFVRELAAFLMVIRDIPAGGELTFDYSTTMAEDFWEEECWCGSPNCRGRIRDFKYLPEATRARYIELGIVPQFAIDSVPPFKKG